MITQDAIRLMVEESAHETEGRPWREVLQSLAPAAIVQAGTLLEKQLRRKPPLQQKSVEILLLGECTTNFLRPAIAAWAWAEGLRITIREGQYNQVVQELQALVGHETPPDIVVLVPWTQRLLASDERGTKERLEDERRFFEEAWRLIHLAKCKLVQVSFDWTSAGVAGYAQAFAADGPMALVQQANRQLRELLPEGAYFVDLEHISAWTGKAAFYDSRNYYWMKQPFSAAGVSELARHIAAGLRCLCRARRKLLALDLDDTLWGGVVGEAGALGVTVGGSGKGEAYKAFQKWVLGLSRTGVLLGVVSKNNDSDAKEPFLSNPEMVLKLGDFASFHASWDRKPERLRQMARELNLGLDSFVFFDDNPAERALMRAELPQVLVVEVPADPSGYIAAIEQSLAFETNLLGEADKARSAQYAAEALRQSEIVKAASPESYLASLQMEASVEQITDANIARVSDLVTKTNQFNLTTRRHSKAAIEAMVSSPESLCFAVRLSDRFGDYGLVAVVLGAPAAPGELRLDTWLMSCRAMGRTLEHFTFNHLTRTAVSAGYERIVAEYLPTTKNEPVKSLLADFGFEELPNTSGLQTLQLKDIHEASTQVKPTEKAP